MERTIKVCHITQALGGVEMTLRAIMQHADDRRFNWHVIAPPVPAGFVTRSGSPVQISSVPFRREIHPLQDGRTLLHTLRCLREIRPDLIHAHSAKGGFIGRLAGALLGIPTLYTPHAWSFLSASSPMRKRLYCMLEKAARPITTRLVACSESERRLACEVIGFREASTTVWLNSIDPASLQPGTPRYDFPYICMVARPSYQKNTRMLAEVMRLLKQRGAGVKCILAGAGHFSPLEQELRDQIRSFGLEDDFIIMEWVGHEQALNLIAHSLCYVSTSRYEGLPFTLVEAMGLGKAVVATDVLGNADCIQDGSTGFLVPSNDSEAMASRVQQVVGNPSLREQLGRNAREHFLGYHDIHKTIGQIEALYERTART